MVYRPYIPEDFAQLYAIEEICFQPPFRFGRRYMRNLAGSAGTATWIAEGTGGMAGFAIAEWNRESGVSTAYLQTLEVLPEFRRQGVARELLARIEGSATAAGVELIWLHVDAENAGAIRLYEARGFRCEGREENYYPKGRDGLIYVKALV